MKTFIVFNLVFPKNKILLSFFSFSLMIDLHFSIPALSAQIFNPIAELAIPTETSVNEANPEIETHQWTAERKQKNI